MLRSAIRDDVRRGSRVSAFGAQRRLARVRRHYLTHVADDASLTAAATIAGMERSYFSACFKAKTGIGFKEWILRLRIERATELIDARDFALADVAYVVGFTDVRSFQRAFKRFKGTTARAYRGASTDAPRLTY